jgi:hypothetical protein
MGKVKRAFILRRRDIQQARGKPPAAFLTEEVMSSFYRHVPKEFMTYEYVKKEKPEVLSDTLFLFGKTINNIISSIENNIKRD